jgi:hypothetical protein
VSRAHPLFPPEPIVPPDEPRNHTETHYRADMTVDMVLKPHEDAHVHCQDLTAVCCAEYGDLRCTAILHGYACTATAALVTLSGATGAAVNCPFAARVAAQFDSRCSWQH